MFIVFTNFLHFLFVYVISYVGLFDFCYYILVIFKVYKLLFLWSDNMRILLAEDERSLSSALVTILKYNNFSVDACFDGLEALSFLNVNNYDLVILDIMMPKLNGLDVLKKIRSDNNKVPVLLLTAKSEIDDKVLGLDLGADDYLTKPFNTKELLARIRALTRRQNDVIDNLISLWRFIFK